MLTLALVVALATAPAGQDQDKVQKLIQALSDASKDERSKAVDDLAKIGPPALEALRKAATSSDLEVKGLANQAIEKIEWVGLEKLKKYVRENLDDGSTLELSKLRGLSKWFPDARFYEVTPAAPAGNNQAMMINMGMGTPKSLIAIRKFEDSFHRLAIKGVYSSTAISTFIQKSKILLPDDDAALDFSVVFLDLQSAAASANTANWMMNGGSRLEKAPDGWALHTGMYGGQVNLRVDKDGLLKEIDPKAGSFNQFGIQDKSAEERSKLEVEKLKLEIDLLKRQIEKK